MMETEQKNTKKIVAIIAVVLAVLLAVAGLTIWSVHVYQANHDPQPSGVTESGGASVLSSEPAGCGIWSTDSPPCRSMNT